LHHEYSKETGRYICFCEVFGVLRRVTSNLAKGPGSSGLDVVLWFVDKGIL